ncbi:MAG: hypothetical protein DBY43_06290 [Clostridiaceae bacterium]|nr:MAG: hypothetical protein DBY43_06290 [Clostridiaceae bacterium]
MKDFAVNLIRLLLSFIILLFSEEYFYKFLSLFKINISKTFTSIILYIIVSFFIYLIYKPELKSEFKKFKRKLMSNMVYAFVAFLIIFVTMLVSNYILSVIAKSFYISYNSISFYNIFNKPFNLDLIIEILKNIILIPYLKVTIFDLGVNRLFSYSGSIFASGLAAALYNAYLIKGTIGYMIVNSSLTFILFMLLALIYRKNNNIVTSIVTYSIYMLLASVLYSSIM